MGFFDILLIGVGLSMDAFAASVCKGLAAWDVTPRQMLTAGAYFGTFQLLMPLIGYLLGFGFHGVIEAFDHWIAFFMLSVIGINMLRGDDNSADADFSIRAMLPLSVATSIDALAVGVTFAFLEVRIIPAALLIGVTTFSLSAIGVCLGSLVDAKLHKTASKLGGVILIGIGVKILLEHLGIIN